MQDLVTELYTALSQTPHPPLPPVASKKHEERCGDMGYEDVLWEPRWDFSPPVAPFVPAELPYSLDDPEYTDFLKANFRFGMQLCMRIYDINNKRVLWRDLAAELGHDFRIGVDFWDAVGVTEDNAQRELVDRVDFPYFGLIDIGTWQWLRPIFGLPDEGITYAHYVDTRYVSTDLLRHTSKGYPYFAGTCLGETTDGVFVIDSGASCCWVKDDWFIGVDMDLTRGVICYNSPDYTAALSANKELEYYPL